MTSGHPIAINQRPAPSSFAGPLVSYSAARRVAGGRRRLHGGRSGCFAGPAGIASRAQRCSVSIVVERERAGRRAGRDARAGAAPRPVPRARPGMTRQVPRPRRREGPSATMTQVHDRPAIWAETLQPVYSVGAVGSGRTSAPAHLASPSMLRSAVAYLGPGELPFRHSCRWSSPRRDRDLPSPFPSSLAHSPRNLLCPRVSRSAPHGYRLMCESHTNSEMRPAGRPLTERPDRDRPLVRLAGRACPPKRGASSFLRHASRPRARAHVGMRADQLTQLDAGRERPGRHGLAFSSCLADIIDVHRMVPASDAHRRHLTLTEPVCRCASEFPAGSHAFISAAPRPRRTHKTSSAPPH